MSIIVSAEGEFVNSVLTCLNFSKIYSLSLGKNANIQNTTYNFVSTILYQCNYPFKCRILFSMFSNGNFS